LPEVFFTKDISSKGLLNIYSRLVLNKELSGNVAVKLHSGEPGGHYYPDPNLINSPVLIHPKDLEKVPEPGKPLKGNDFEKFVKRMSEEIARYLNLEEK